MRQCIVRGGMLALAAVFAFAGLHAAAEDEEPLNVLLITGGGWHDYEAQQDILTEGISERANVEFTIDFEGGLDASAKISRHEDPDWAEPWDLVLYNICYSGVTDSEYVQRVVNSHVEHGVPAVALHATMHSYSFQEDNPIWWDFLGARSERHQSHMPFEVEVLAPDHPVMQGFPDGWETPEGELYEIEEMMPTATPCAHSYGEDSGEHHINVWTNEYEGVRVFATTIGHHNVTMEAPEYLDLVTRGLLWAAGRLEDE